MLTSVIIQKHEETDWVLKHLTQITSHKVSQLGTQAATSADALLPVPCLSGTCQFLSNGFELLRTDVHILVSVQRGKEKEAICPQSLQCGFLLGRKGLG
jgi:hypothetical protein